MTRKTISFTKPNDEWIKEQLASEEYTSNSELVNDLIRKARLEQEYIEFVRSKLKKAEERGLSELSPEEIRLKVRRDINIDD